MSDDIHMQEEVNQDPKPVKESEESQFLTREDLLTKQPREFVKVELSKGHIYVRDLYGDEKEAFEQSTTERVVQNGAEIMKPKTEFFKAKVIVLCACDKNGNLIFNDDEYDMVSAMMKAPDIDRAFKKAAELNQFGMFGEDDEKN